MTVFAAWHSCLKLETPLLPIVRDFEFACTYFSFFERAWNAQTCIEIDTVDKNCLTTPRSLNSVTNYAPPSSLCRLSCLCTVLSSEQLGEISSKLTVIFCGYLQFQMKREAVWFYSRKKTTLICASWIWHIPCTWKVTRKRNRRQSYLIFFVS